MGTDAQRYFDQVILTDTFSAAVEAALLQQTYALVAAGFMERDRAGVITGGGWICTSVSWDGLRSPTRGWPPQNRCV
ncbi:hypothetical protein [Streptomyces yangpuensis]|uniref:hypothetical protein n=1 Tax=Streptomyces yangpuensis TaxID=1648182 RepID=UPI0038124B70